nr:immunoglobulin heavy chain junction region [Mus musculus]
CARGGYAMDYW